MKGELSAIGFTQLSNSTGGQTTYAGRGGQILRNKTNGRQPRTKAQMAVRSNFKSLSTTWRTLTKTHQQSWIDAAPNFPVVKKGKIIPLTGSQLFQQTNQKLLNAGLPIINNYTPPVANPPGEGLTRIYTGYDNTDGTITFIYSKTYWQQTFPTGDWSPSFLWTGWIPPSRYNYPPMNLALKGADNFYEYDIYDLVMTTDDPTSTPPPGEGYKMQFQERWINSVTGQIFTGNTIECLAETQNAPTPPYAPGTVWVSYGFSGSPGNNQATLTLKRTGDAYDPNTWEPNFFYYTWTGPSVPANYPLLNIIPTTAIVFTLPDSFIIYFSNTTGNAPAPPDYGDIMQIALVWKNTATGELVYDTTLFATATNA